MVDVIIPPTIGVAMAEFQALPGRGAEGLVNGKTVVVGGPRLLIETKGLPKRDNTTDAN